MLSCFHLIRNVTDGRTDRFAISISRVSVLTRDKNDNKIHKTSLDSPIRVSPDIVEFVGD